KSSESVRDTTAGAPKDPPLLSFAALFDAYEGRVDEARRALNELEQLQQARYVEPMLVTEVCFALRDRECLLKWFGRGHDERSTQFVYTILEPDVYGNDARMQVLAKDIR
ncbi:MAG: hypothetical protein JOZ62_03680, partial [Acidobacteriaceae bacterium]|nr:hypothetical protein [Acidobacteriaceae bacterium]